MEDVYLVVYLSLDLHCVQNWISDGQCDDINNHNMDNCNYDGGDCCGSNVVNKYCFNCSCLSNTNKLLFTQNKALFFPFLLSISRCQCSQANLGVNITIEVIRVIFHIHHYIRIKSLLDLKIFRGLLPYSWKLFGQLSSFSFGVLFLWGT